MKELKRLLPYIKKYKKSMIAGFMFVILGNICSAFLPRILGNTIDTIKLGRFTESDIFRSILIILSLAISSAIFMFFTRRTIIVASRHIEYDLRKDFLDFLERQPVSFFQKNPAGSLMAHATNDIGAAREFLGPAVMWAANTVTTFIFALYFMLSLNPGITLFSLLPMPFIALVVYKIGRRIHNSFKSVQQKFSELTTQAQESFSGVRVIRAYRREEYEELKFGESSGEYFTENMKYSRIQAVTMPILMVLIGLSQLIVLGYGGWNVMEGNITIGELTQFFIYLNLLIWPVAAIGWITNIVQRASASAARLGELFDNAGKNREYERNDLNMEIINPSVKFQNVSLKYDDKNDLALDNISFSIDAGSKLGVVGPIGSGKSSLISLLTRLHIPGSGEVFINDINIKDIPLRKLRRSIGVVPQEPFLFSMSIADNIRFGKPDATVEEVIRAAKTAELHEEIGKFPDKYDSILGEKGITLSGGQKQRLAIARALLIAPPVLIFDDAFSSIDTRTESRIISNLASIKENRTVIIISHRISTVMNSDNIIYLEKGKITESGTHNELAGLRNKYYNLYSRQLLEEEIVQIQ